MSDSTCPFCARLEAGEALDENDLAAALADAYPITLGHTLIVPRRHEADYFALTGDEQDAIHALVRVMRQRLTDQYQPTAFNLGVNAGADAGQTIPHAHLHLIPRYPGDRDDARGGVRWIIPDKAPYWEDG
jgi:diadenosine tetraphosphate (Ap4A) HIT family hydrolase